MTVWTNSSGDAVTAHRLGAIAKQEMPEEQPDPRAATIFALRRLLADAISLYLRAHGYHWNVVGSDFAEYHALFESIYSDIYESVDPIAENIRKLEGVAPFRLPEIMALRTLTDQPLPAPLPTAMTSDLLAGTVAILETLRAAFAAASAADEQGIANFIAERIDAHQKHEWMLRSSLAS